MSNPAFKFDHVHIISKDPEASANWYAEMFGATIAANTMARGAPQIFVDLGGMTIPIRGQRPGEARKRSDILQKLAWTLWEPACGAGRRIPRSSRRPCAGLDLSASRVDFGARLREIWRLASKGQSRRACREL